MWSVPYATLWHELRARWQASFTPEERAPWDAVGDASLVQCDRCELQYFSPPLAGSADFYERLSHHPEYYVDDRWEFDEVVRSLHASDVVIDFGSGRGAFLRRAAEVAARVVGCDHNEGAAPVSIGGATLLRESFRDVADAHASSADVVTSFHVLEHLDDVDALCIPATTALRTGGRLFLSTPDRQRTVRDDIEALDCPPHHLSRWSVHQYEVLAARYGLDLVGVRHEPFVHIHGARRFVPRPVLHAAAMARHRARGFRVRAPSASRGGPWPRGAALLVELVKR